jgi:hypothetical protein
MRRRLDWTAQDPDGKSNINNTIGTRVSATRSFITWSLPRVLTRIAVSQRSKIAAVSSIVPTTYQAKMVHNSRLNDYTKPVIA